MWRSAVDRLACVDVAALPLQLLLRRHPDWAPFPVAVVEDDRPQAPVLFLNVRAYRAGVRSGQRYATALSLAPALHGGTVSSSEIERGVCAIADRLRRYSPHVEPAMDGPRRASPSTRFGAHHGVFWLDARGLERLYPSLDDWADRLRGDLLDHGFTASVAVGFSRFGVQALAVTHRGTLVCADHADERARVDKVPLARLALDHDVRDRLLALGIETVGEFLRLPGDGIRIRFGAAAEDLHRLAAGSRWTTLVPVPAEERYEAPLELDAPETHVDRLVFAIKRLLDDLVAALMPRQQSIVEIVVSMTLDDRTSRVERVRPADPTLDVAQLLTLVRLRLETLQLTAGIVSLRAAVETSAAASDQRRLFTESRRDNDAANRALARIRAECGERSVVRARLCDAHLPSARFTWEPLDHVTTHAAPRATAVRPLVRRIYTTPVPLGHELPKGAWGGAVRPTSERRDVRQSERVPEGVRLARAVSAIAERPVTVSSPAERTEAALFDPSARSGSPRAGRGASVVSAEAGRHRPKRLSGADDRKTDVPRYGSPRHDTADDSVPDGVSVCGPYVVSGGWWGGPPQRGGAHRDYYFVRTQAGDIWWVYYDRRRNGFFLQGSVE